MKRYSLLLLILFLSVSSINAQWNSSSGLLIHSNEVNGRSWWAVGDSRGGAWIALMNNMAIPQPYLQRIDSSGYCYYPSTGLSLTGLENQNHTLRIKDMISDHQGGVFVSIMDLTTGPELGLHLVKIDENGEKTWGDNGINITDGHLQGNSIKPGVCEDGMGGVFTAFYTSFECDSISVRHLLNNGEVDTTFDLSVPVLEPVGLFPTSNGQGLYMLGFNPQNNAQLTLYRVNSDGTVEFLTSYTDETAYGFPLKDFYLVHCDENSVWLSVEYENDHLFVMKYDNNGNIFGTPFIHADTTYNSISFSDVTVDNEGYAYYTVSELGGYRPIVLFKRDYEGNFVWENRGVQVRTRQSSNLFYDAEENSIIIGIEHGIYDDYVYMQSITTEGSFNWHEYSVLMMFLRGYRFSSKNYIIKSCDNAYIYILASEHKIFAGKIFNNGVVADYTNSVHLDSDLPSEIKISMISPNPFNPTTNVEFALVEQADVKAKLYNIMGQEVAVVLDQKMNAGFHKVTVDGTDLASGVYFLEFNAGPISDVRKIVLLK